jgi:hypothetical protein
MVANIRGYTPNYKFKLVNFDTPRWHTLEYANWTSVDSLLLQAGIPQIRGDWTYSTLYLVGDRVTDADTNVLYRCLVQHTSAASGTFTTDRALHPTYWTLQTFGVPIFRGVWQASATYSLGDIVVVGTYAYYLCIADHTSSSTFPPDATKWTLVFDATAAVDITTAKATEASNSAIAAATSATNASNSATQAAASAVESAAQAQKLFGTSTTSNLVGLGAKSFTTQSGKYFNVGKFLMVRATTNPVDAWMWGQVASYSGTALVLNSQAFAGSGAFADWIIDVSGIKGADGTGGGGTSSVTTSDTPPATPHDGDMWWKTDSGVLYVYYDDGDSQQWVQATAVPFVDYSAAPFDAMAYNGMQVNGSMEVSQELGLNTRVGSGYVIDSWAQFTNGSTMVVVAASAATAFVAGLPMTLYSSTATAQTSIGVNDYCFFRQPIEGYRIRRLAWGGASARPITLAFWSMHNRTGLYSGAIRNGSNTHSYAFTYTQAASNVAQYNVITIPGCSVGVWDVDNNTGMWLIFTQAVGSSAIAPSANTWVAGSYIAAPGQVNAVAATSDVFRITGVVIVPGIYAPTAQQSPLIMRSYDQELLLCQRYFYKTFPYGVAVAAASGIQDHIGFTIRAGAQVHIFPTRTFPVEMRATPTVTYYNPVTAASSQARDISGNFDCTNTSSQTTTTKGFTVVTTPNASTGIGYLLCVSATADARL